MNAIIGYTGFVGKNLDKQFKFDKKYNSTNIKDIRNKKFGLVVCSGIRGVKWLANQDPELDQMKIDNLKSELKTIIADKFILISTVDVYSKPICVSENTKIDTTDLHVYGQHRYSMEKWVEKTFKNYLIVRLPALFGFGLNKNFIFDLLEPIPNTITEDKWRELKSILNADNYSLLSLAFVKDTNGNYRFSTNIAECDIIKIRNILKKVGFTSLVFTDHRSKFQFYNLDNIWKDIQIALKSNLGIINLAVEPISAKEVAMSCCGIKFDNVILNKLPLSYDMKSIHYKLYHGNDDYLYQKQQTIAYLKEFINKNKRF